MAFKSFIKNKSLELEIPPQVVLQNYMFERFLTRLEKSPYQYKFIIKGGFLIAALVGVGARTTMDLDVTIHGFPLTETSIEKIIQEIISVETDDLIDFRYIASEDIRPTDDYPGIRIKLEATYESIKVSLKLDLTTGDIITPGHIDFHYPMFSENRYIHLYSYNIESVLAEKIETIISRSVLNTRPRDFYDVFVLYRMYKEKISIQVLKEALINTSNKRGSLQQILDFESHIEAIMHDTRLHNFWKKYQNQYDYAKEVIFEDTVQTLRLILLQLNISGESVKIQF